MILRNTDQENQFLCFLILNKGFIMDHFIWKFDLDLHPVHTLMHLSGLRTDVAKTRYFSENGSYISFNKNIAALNTEKTWIKQFYDFYLQNQNTIFCLAEVTGCNKESSKMLDQLLMDKNSFIEFKKEINFRFRTDELGLEPLYFIEQLSSDGMVFVYVLYYINLSKTESDCRQLYSALYALAENGDFSQHEYGIYASNDLNEIVINTHNHIHDGLLIHATECPWFQKKFEYIGNLQGLAALILMIGAVLFLNEILSLPFGFVLLTLILGIGVFAFIRSRKNTASLPD